MLVLVLMMRDQPRFLGKELGVEEFLAQYVATRQASHLQKLKADKVKESG